MLTGTVSRVDQKVRITGTLNNPRTDEAIWNKPDDKNRTDIFAIQAELAQAIAGELNTVLSSAEKKLVEPRATEDPLAYDFFSRHATNATVPRGEGASRWMNKPGCWSRLERATTRWPVLGRSWLARMHWST